MLGSGYTSVNCEKMRSLLKLFVTFTGCFPPNYSYTLHENPYFFVHLELQEIQNCNFGKFVCGSFCRILCNNSVLISRGLFTSFMSSVACFRCRNYTPIYPSVMWLLSVVYFMDKIFRRKVRFLDIRCLNVKFLNNRDTA